MPKKLRKFDKKYYKNFIFLLLNVPKLDNMDVLCYHYYYNIHRLMMYNLFKEVYKCHLILKIKT